MGSMAALASVLVVPAEKERLCCGTESCGHTIIEHGSHVGYLHRGQVGTAALWSQKANLFLTPLAPTPCSSCAIPAKALAACSLAGFTMSLHQTRFSQCGW